MHSPNESDLEDISPQGVVPWYRTSKDVQPFALHRTIRVGFVALCTPFHTSLTRYLVSRSRGTVILLHSSISLVQQLNERALGRSGN